MLDDDIQKGKIAVKYATEDDFHCWTRVQVI